MIRPATHADLPALLALTRQMHLEGRFQHAALDEEKVELIFRHCIESEFFVVSESSDGVDGMLAGICTELWFSRSYAAHDLIFFVRPIRRGGFAAVRMIQAFVTWAKVHGAAEVAISQSSGARVEEMQRLMTGMQFDYMGGVFKWRFG